ncbi:MAG: plasmid mobilization protein [Acidiferrobacteraceae bacterium]
MTQRGDPWISFRCSSDCQARIRAKADQAGLTVSEFIRRVVQNRAIPAVADQELVGQLKRVGALLKHRYPKASNWTLEEKRRYWAGHEELMALAAQLQATIERHRSR